MDRLTSIGYSDGMTNTLAPDITPGYPSKGAKLGPAWSLIWSRLRDRPDEFLDGRVLAAEVAADQGLAESTLVALISRAAQAGLLDRDPRPVRSENRGMRTRTHYRISKLGRAAEEQAGRTPGA